MDFLKIQLKKILTYGLAIAGFSLPSVAAENVIECGGPFKKAKISFDRNEEGELVASGRLYNMVRQVASFEGVVSSLRKLPIYGADDAFEFEVERAPIQGKFVNRSGSLYRPVTEDDVVVRFKTDVAPHYKTDLVIYIVKKEDFLGYGATAVYGPCEVQVDELLSLIGD